MKWITKIFFGSLLLLCCVTVPAYFLWKRPQLQNQQVQNFLKMPGRIITNNATGTKLKKEIAAVKSFAEGKRYNSGICFMIDMGIESGRARFFVYNLQKDSIELSGLVAHGQGSSRAEIEFSNEPGSYCTSLGKYRIGRAYMGKFGLAYKLSGLDSTNSKALERFVVLHSHSCVPDAEVAPAGICQSQGCPTVSPEFLKKLAKYIDASEKPMLLNIYR